MLTRKEIERIKESGEVPTVGLEIFDTINNFKFDDKTLDNEKYDLEMYKEYIEEILTMEKEHVNNYLSVLKSAEIIDNQSLENEDSFLMALYRQIAKENTIDYLLDHHQNLTKNSFIKGQSILLEGTSSDVFSKENLRTDDETFILRKQNDEEKIVYFAINNNDIDEAIEKFLAIYNSDIYDNNIFLKSQIVHGLIATLQMFYDGNTRYARILQNIKLWDLTRKKEQYPLENPAIYGTRSYFPYREEYRKLIGNIAVSNTKEAWNDWFKFNLNRMIDHIYFLENKLSNYKRVLKR